MALTPQQAEELRILEERERRRRIRGSMNEWALHNGFNPAAHHRLLNACIEKAAVVPNSKYIFCLPRNAAKSTYTSKLAVPWMFNPEVRKLREANGRQLNSILAASHNKDLIAGFGKDCRNRIEAHPKELGYSLRRDSKAADDWGTTHGCLYYCTGIGAGISGHRGDIGIIDDYLGSSEDADSDLIRDKIWDWYVADFLGCINPGASILIVATRWHEDDLIGRLLKTEKEKWTLISIPLIAKENDPLGRKPGERLWAEYYDDEKERQARIEPRIFSAVWQQEPSAEDGDFFKKDALDMCCYHSLSELPADLNPHATSDHAVSKREEADKTCMIPTGVDASKMIWVLPAPLEWGKFASNEQVEKMFGIVRALKARYGAVWWVAEKEKITQCLGPYIFEKMVEDDEFFVIEQVTPKKDKRWRANTLQSLVNTGRIRFPAFASWWPAARRELLAFDNLGEDDFVDALSHLARKIHGGVRKAKQPKPEPETVAPAFDIHKDLTMAWIKDGINHRERQNRLALQDD